MTNEERPRLAKAKADIEKLNAAAADDPAELLIDTKTSEIFIYGEIGEYDVSAKQVASALKQFDKRDVTIYLNTPGGSVAEGVAIFNLIQRHTGRVRIVVDGKCCSIGSVILCAAQERLIDRNSCVMIHRPWSGAVGDEDSMRREAELLQRFGAMIAGIYARATGKTVSEIEAAMVSETWLFGVEAVDWKICTGLVGSDPGYRPKLAAARRACLRVRMEMLEDQSRMLDAAYGLE